MYCSYGKRQWQPFIIVNLYSCHIFIIVSISNVSLTADLLHSCLPILSRTPCDLSHGICFCHPTGRSILLYNSNYRACATIQGSETLIHAAVNGHIAGSVELRRVGTRYAVFTNLFNTRSLDSTTTRWACLSFGPMLSYSCLPVYAVLDADNLKQLKFSYFCR